MTLGSRVAGRNAGSGWPTFANQAKDNERYRESNRSLAISGLKTKLHAWNKLKGRKTLECMREGLKL